MVLWSRVRSDDHHEGNPHPDDVPQKKENGPRVTDNDVVGDDDE
jgi:hypothetical protein